jgi:transposase InsO family protein
VVRQGYYRWLTDGPCQRERTDAELTKQIREIHAELHGHPGVRRVWAELVVRGLRVAHKRVWRLMTAAGLRGRHPRAWKRTTVAGQQPVDAPDLIGQDFTAEQPDTRWCGDITYVRTVDGWVYTATVIDLHSRKVVGYAVADHLRTSLIVEALAAALVTRRPPSGVIFHSDRGCQYTSREFADFCAENGVVRSMGRRATCFDNAVAESFFATYKKELIHTRPWNDASEVRQQTFLWIEGYYNRRRRHSTLAYLTPIEYELGFRKLTDLAA